MKRSFLFGFGAIGFALAASLTSPANAEQNCRDITAVGCACHDQKVRLDQSPSDPKLKGALEECVSIYITTEGSRGHRASPS